MRSAWYYVKLGFLTIALFLESFILAALINSYVLKGDFFSLSIPFSLQVVGLMAGISLTFALTIGAWNSWYFYFVVPAAIAAGIMLPLLPTSTTYALVAAGVAFIVIIAESYRSYRIKAILLDFVPLIVLRFAVRGILLVFSILGGLLIILNASNAKNLDIGKMIADVAAKPLKSTVNSQLQETIERQTIYSGYTEEEVKQLLAQYGIESGNISELNTENLNIDVNDMLQRQINSYIEPYKEFVRPLMAILVFGLFQLYATVGYVVYSLLVGIFIAIAKKTNFLRVFTETVEKKDLQF